MAEVLPEGTVTPCSRCWLRFVSTQPAWSRIALYSPAVMWLKIAQPNSFVTSESDSGPVVDTVMPCTGLSRSSLT